MTDIASRMITAALLLLTFAIGLAQAETEDGQGLWLLALGQGSLGSADPAPATVFP